MLEIGTMGRKLVLLAGVVFAAAQTTLQAEEGRKEATRSTEQETIQQTPAPAGGILQPTIEGGAIGISGATLFRDFFEFPASSNDWINANCDFDCFSDPGECIGGEVGDDCDPDATDCAYRGYNENRPVTCAVAEVDRLIDSLPSAGTTFTTWWLLNYRAVGSTNGVQDFVNSQVSFLNSLQNSEFSPRGEDPGSPYIGDKAGCPAACNDVDNQIWANVCGAGNACGDSCDLECVCSELSIAGECTPQAVCESFGCTQQGCCFCELNFPTSTPSEESNLNRQRYYDPNVGDCTSDFTPDPACPDTCSPVCMRFVDIASSDVPVGWAIQTGDDLDARWDRNPTAGGYGRNPVESSTGFSNRLKNLFFECNGIPGIQPEEELNADIGSPDSRTVFNNSLAHSPVAFLANRGTGVEHVDQSDLQHLFIAGRFKNGMNLVATTRDSGSGTRNDAMNGIGVDPSWGRGDNVGSKVGETAASDLGPGTQRNNLGGSSVMENGVTNERLALGYTGLTGPSRAVSDAVSGRYEILNLRNDVDGTESAQYVRPSIDTVLDNCDPDTGYQVSAEQTLATRGNVNANRSENDPFFAAGAPAVGHQAAADYLLNILDSQREFDPNFPDDQFLMPGQLLSRTFFTPAGVDCLPNELDPSVYDATPGFNQGLQDYMRANIDMGSGLEAPWFGDTPDFGAVNIAGRVPVRTNNPDFEPKGDGPENIYSDGSEAGEFCYYDAGNNLQPALVGGNDLSEANQVAGDFNLDKTRSLGDVSAMISAMFRPRAWQQSGAGNGPDSERGDMNFDQAIPEVIGDFNGDGDFNKEDLRYFMDGLYINSSTGNLDRAAAAVAIDNAILAYASANLPGDPESWLPWGLSSADRWPEPAPAWSSGDSVRCQERTLTPPGPGAAGGSLLGGRPYETGDFRADVAGRTPFPGAQPVGADGVVDDADIAYVVDNVGDWTDPYRAPFIDLSCDMNGDLRIDEEDIAFVKAVAGQGGGGECPMSCCPLTGDIRAGANGLGADGLVNIFDILAILDQFIAQTDALCSSPSGADDRSMADWLPPAHVTVVSRRESVSAGGEFVVDVFAEGLVDLAGYEIALDVFTSSGRGQLELVDMYVDPTNESGVFARASSLSANHMEGRRIVNISNGGRANLNGGPAYLATFTFRAGPETNGTFTIDLVNPGSYLIGSQSQTIDIASTLGATVTVR